MIQNLSIYSKSLNREVNISIYLPASYNQVERYPVLYMHDGHNLFNEETSSFGHTWQVQDAFKYDIKDIIVVGIDAAQDERRLSELCPWENNMSKGHGDAYLTFVLEVKRHIDNMYLTLPDRSNTGLMGSSMGGYITTYAMTKYNDFFSKYGLLSNAYWIDDRIFAEVEKSEINDSMIYLDYGTKETGIGTINEYIETNRRMVEILLNKGIDLNHHEFKNALHNEMEWAVRLPLILRYLFGGKKNEINF